MTFLNAWCRVLLNQCRVGPLVGRPVSGGFYWGSVLPQVFSMEEMFKNKQKTYYILNTMISKLFKLLYLQTDSIESINVHPGYSNTSHQFDIALLRLKKMPGLEPGQLADLTSIELLT